MLENITAAKLKNMTLKELIALCEEAREVITSTVLKNGGHLSSNLQSSGNRSSCMTGIIAVVRALFAFGEARNTAFLP